MTDIYNHWWANPDFEDVDFHTGFERRPKNTIPHLDSVIFQQNSIKRFSLFMWQEPKERGGAVQAHNATHLVQQNGGGGVTWLHGPVSQNLDTLKPFDDSTAEYVKTHPVSIIYQSDSWKPKFDFVFSRLGGSLDSTRFPKGGRLYVTNAIGNELGPVTSIPLGSMDPKFEIHLNDRSQNKDRNTRLMCCCMYPRASRDTRIAKLNNLNGGVCGDVPLQMTSPQEYAVRLSNSKFALSPIGQGKQCFRDVETIVAGSVPVLDAYISGGPMLYDREMPVLHQPICGHTYCRMENMTAAYFDREYAKLEARRNELNVAKAFWPYWLYQVFRQVPPRSTEN